MELDVISSQSGESTPSPSPDVDDAVGVPKPKWFVAIVNSRHEKMIARQFQNLNIESFVATQSEMRVWANGKRKELDRVVIPAKVFVRCTEKQRREIVKLPFVNRFMVNRSLESPTVGSPIAVIPDAQIQTLRFMLGQTDHPVTFTDRIFKPKDIVRVVRGKLRGLTGTIINNPDGSHNLIVSLSLLGGASVHIDPSDVEKIN
ncbi:MAG: UpxY family transcription antiterminator [Muribaculaceae bacterium]|nr:UpxY family transcription antiterminator [Muribaculaceae bacterium]